MQNQVEQLFKSHYRRMYMLAAAAEGERVCKGHTEDIINGRLVRDG